jgi:hypothetical protein
LGRTFDSATALELPKAQIFPAVLAQLTFKSETKFIWTGAQDLVYAGNTYLGVGALGEAGPVTESSDVRAEGTSVRLSGIALDLLSETLGDIQLGAPAKLWAAFLANGAVVGMPYLYFSGTVDKPEVLIAKEQFNITLALENRLVNLARASMRRYTAADQHLSYPDDTGFNWVEILNDIALRWGS